MIAADRFDGAREVPSVTSNGVRCVTEKVVAVAVRRNGLIYTAPPPARHGDVIRLVDEGHGQQHAPFLPDEQGFLTSTGRFLGRVGAAALAISAGQISATKWGRELYSEDLW